MNAGKRERGNLEPVNVGTREPLNLKTAIFRGLLEHRQFESALSFRFVAKGIYGRESRFQVVRCCASVD
jgi:hypothetical protein